MERALNQDERIRRAEEIYAKRQNLREKTKKATLSVTDEEPKAVKIIKRICLQIVICILIYFIFYLVNTTDYSFSEQVLSKKDEFLSYDEDFIGIYNNMVQNIEKYIDDSEKIENDIIEEEIIDEEIEETNEETTEQEELGLVEESETDRIKENYSFVVPLAGTITSEFGTRESTSSIVSTYHKGIDIAAEQGKEIISAIDGNVIISKYSSSYGNYIIIENRRS